jgi:Zincin-like metallopeptidase
MHRLFRDAESYHATRADKTCHWTRHPSRLDRELGRKRFGDEGYAMEELVAGALNVNGTVTATNFSDSGTGLTGIGTSNLAAITGTPSTTTYLRGDGTWGTIGGTLSGGVASYIPLWTSATAIGTSNIYQNGSNIGIGTAGATFPDVNGSIRTNASLFTNTLQTLSTSANMTFMVNGQNAVIITSSVPNYVGIGTTTPSTAPQVVADRHGRNHQWHGNGNHLLRLGRIID